MDVIGFEEERSIVVDDQVSDDWFHAAMEDDKGGSLEILRRTKKIAFDQQIDRKTRLWAAVVILTTTSCKLLLWSRWRIDGRIGWQTAVLLLA